jgi:hypothetical protein
MRSASASSRPTTFGTTRTLGPPETVSFTVVPRRATVPPAGDCVSTVPVGWPEETAVDCTRKPACLMRATASVSRVPTTFGIVAVPVVGVVSVDPAAAPATLICTAEPSGTRAPARGLWAMTVTTGSCERTFTTLDRSPLRFSLVTAAACWRPSTRGTVTIRAPGETPSTTSLPLRASAPAGGRA